MAGEQPAAAAAGNAVQPQPDGAAPAAPPAGGVRALPAAGVEQRGGLLRELQALVLGFFTSLIPGAQAGCPAALLDANGFPPPPSSSFANHSLASQPGAPAHIAFLVCCRLECQS